MIGDLGAMPDRERAHLSAGRRSGWPQVLRIEQSDYPDRPDPRRRLSARDVDRLEAVLLGPDALALAIPPQHRALVGLAAAMKLWPDAGGFRWDAVRERVKARVDAGERVPAGDALRMRYDRAVAMLAAAMAKVDRGVWE
ncbi:hypothetical protein VCJ71_12100 [Alteriqipengyuania sp. WL0013]|uniref:hypothetical protein n=1 Tax=Alteriqipengyuania sp. WL0013 TaxID=3110773 RepID=UPI002D15EA61|nr:hypothetical protein [Alteriqipengyuania sp. WL0013]MEB3416805.1 hypothetical protein [Alteriqipengyuania sp. WL0013]